MSIDPDALQELKRICAESLNTPLSDVEAHEIGQRIIRFLQNTVEDEPSAASVDPVSEDAVGL